MDKLKPCPNCKNLKHPDFPCIRCYPLNPVFVRRPASNTNTDTTLAAAEARIAELESKVLLPGVMRCAKCDFRLLRTTLNLRSGTATAGGSKTEPCPNGCGPLWPVTEREERKELQELVDRYHDRITALEKALEAALRYIKESPCDPDINKKQREAWSELQALKPTVLLTEVQ